MPQPKMLATRLSMFVATVLLFEIALASSCNPSMPSMRPAVEDRLFQSPTVESFVALVADKIKDPDLQTLFKNTFPNTLDTTVLSHVRAPASLGWQQAEVVPEQRGNPSMRLGTKSSGVGLAAEGGNDTFIVTGDIHAMWLRDSYNQVKPYIDVLHSLRRGLSHAKRTGATAAGSTEQVPAWVLYSSVQEEQPDALDEAFARAALRDGANGEELLFLVSGLIARQASQVAFDPYANAFSISADVPSPHADDSTTRPAFAGTTIDAMQSPVFERKYELDSLCAFLRLSADYYAATGDIGPFLQGTTQGDAWLRAVETVLATMKLQQIDSATEGGNPPYFFQRTTSEPTDSLEHGRGAPCKHTGLIKTGFRGSDDASTFPYLIPSNVMAVGALTQVQAVLDGPAGAPKLAQEAQALAQEVSDAIEAHALITPAAPAHSSQSLPAQYAYEIDGFGNVFIADDANIPSLLSLPLLKHPGINASTPAYKATREAVLSTRNPYYYSGSAASGIGGPHNGQGWIWPMSISAQSLTS